MSNARHRVRGLFVDGEVVILPEDVGFVRLAGRVEGRRVYLGVESGVDDPAQRASRLWSEGHEGGRARSGTNRHEPQ